MKHLTANIRVSKEFLPILNERLTHPCSTLERDEVFWENTAGFDDGCFVLYQVIASGCPSEESCWAQFVLFNKNGHEMAVSDVQEDAGEASWTVEVDGTEYSAALLPV
jgi:hypothetical protein